MVILDYWLSQCYHASLKGDKEVLEAFKKRIKADHALAKEARQRVPALESVNRIPGGSRCFISAKYLEILRSALS